MSHIQHAQHRRRRARAGFTLVELLVVVGILLVLTVMTVGALNVSMEGDRVRGSARQVQSYLEGAKDRAIYAGQSGLPAQERGVRFLLEQNDVDNVDDDAINNDPNNPKPIKRTITSMVFISASEPWSQGTIKIHNDTNDPPQLRLVVGQKPDPHDPAVLLTRWDSLRQRGLLKDGARIRISGRWYTVHMTRVPRSLIPELVWNAPTTDRNAILYLTSDFLGGADGHFPLEVPQYQLELPPTVMPNQDVMNLSTAVVINLGEKPDSPNRRSRPPGQWYDSSTGRWKDQLDIMFSSRGTVTGPPAALGLIHLYVSDQADAATTPTDPPLPGLDPADPANKAAPLLVSIFTHTGNISVHPVDITDANLDLRADDPYRFAETGEVAAQ